MMNYECRDTQGVRILGSRVRRCRGSRWSEWLRLESLVVLRVLTTHHHSGPACTREGYVVEECRGWWRLLGSPW